MLFDLKFKCLSCGKEFRESDVNEWLDEFGEDDLFYALRRPCGSSFDRLYNEYKAVFILQVDPGVELCFAFDAESGVVSRAYIESGCE